MPMYEYLCGQRHVTVAYNTVDERANGPACRCGEPTHKVILTAPRVFGDYDGYESPVSGRWVEGKRARQEDLRSNQCRPYEAGEKDEFVRRQAAADRQEDKFIDQVVEQTVADLTK